jgi:uroporphyrinogen-III synthase
MIPKVLPPLTGLSVLVTRPAAQAEVLCKAIANAGGEAVALPAIEIELLQAEPVSSCDLAVFVSVNAVAHGAHLLPRNTAMKVAAIGKATAAALAQAQLPASIVPEGGFDSESLLAHPQLELAPGARVVVVRGVGGREVLQQTFAAHAMIVETREVYRRVAPRVDPERIDAIEAQWNDGGIDVVTITSVETLNNLLGLLGERGRALLRRTALVLASRRIMEAAANSGCEGLMILAAGADDQSTIAALALWQTRARARSN